MPESQIFIPAKFLSKPDLASVLFAQKSVLDVGGTYSDLVKYDLRALCEARGIGKGGKKLTKKDLIAKLEALEQPE